MMKSSILALLLSLILGTTIAHGAVYTVNAGQTIQSAIDSASSGDEIIVNGAFFEEDLVIDGKSLTLRRQSLISEINSISFTNASGTSILEGFKVRQDLNATGSDIKIRDCDIIGFVLINDGDLTIGNSKFHQSVNVNQGSLSLTKSIVDQNVTINLPIDSSGSPTRTVIAQSTISEKLTSNASDSFVSYNTIRHSTFKGNATVIGNTIDGRNLESIGIDLNGTGSRAKVSNNLIRNFNTNTSRDLENVCIGISVGNGTQAEITNNLIYNCYDHGHLGNTNKVGIGIYVESSTGNLILGNILWNCYSYAYSGNNPAHRLIWAPPSGTLVMNNLFWRLDVKQSTNYVGGGVYASDSIEGNPGFSSYPNNIDFTLASDSPCIDKGPPDPQYNDRDGSRNDIGMFGGHNFIPDGRTTNKPIVLGLDIAPIAVPTGGTITIESTGATVK
jgi:hypothetical protein